MKEKTKLLIVEKIAQNLSLQDRFSNLEKIAVWAYYLLEMGIFQICLLISITEPRLQIHQILSKQPSLQRTFFILRLSASCLYLLTKSSYAIFVIKLLQISNVYLIRTELCAIPLIFQSIAHLYLTIRKQKRNVNFDSRLESKYFGMKALAVNVLLLTTFLTQNNEISKTPSTVFLIALVYYVSACLDNIFSYRTKQILRTIAICPILMSIYFMFIPLVPIFNSFGLAIHAFASIFVITVVIIYGILSKYRYNHEILHKKILYLQSRDKLLYIWSLIYFCQSLTQNNLIIFIKTHQLKCFDPLCPINFNQISTKINSYPHSIQATVRIYLKKVLERFSTENDQIRRLFIYYTKQDNSKIIHLLRQDDIYEKLQQIRIIKNLEKSTDPSVQYERMKQIEVETENKVKLFINHYDHLLSIINKESIKISTAEHTVKEILKLKTYFLSFQQEKLIPQLQLEDIKQQKSQKEIKKNAKGYQKIQSNKIPIKKMTCKTAILVNFMRRIYFSLPSLQQQQFTSKKLPYISQDFQQSPILVVSAESYNLGKIINSNTMIQKILLYSTQQLHSKFINDFLPKNIQKIHNKLLMKAALSIEVGQISKQFKSYIFCLSKAFYTQFFEVKTHGINSVSGNKWIVELKHHFEYQAAVVCDEYKRIVGVNKNTINFGIKLSVIGLQMNEQLFNRLVDKKQKVFLSQDFEVIQGIYFQNRTEWDFVCTTPEYKDIPQYYIFKIVHSNKVQKTTLTQFLKQTEKQIEVNNNEFEFNFDPFGLKYTNSPLKSYQGQNLGKVWRQSQSIDQKQFNFYILNSYKSAKQRNYGEYIHQMIYFDHKLQFKENYQQATQFQTHPNYIQNSKNYQNIIINISKQNFVENVSKIKKQTPSFVCKLIGLFIFISILIFVTLTLRYLYFNTLYNLTKEKQLINYQTSNRLSIIHNIGSLAVYYNKSNQYPTVWQHYLSNNWTYGELFVQIEYTNVKINKLRSQIGLLVSKSYPADGKQKTLASIYELLSIEASTQSAGNLNFVNFIKSIVNDIQKIQNLIQADVDLYYQTKNRDIRTNIFIIDFCQIILCIVGGIFMHVVLRKYYEQKIQLLKSLSIVEEEEVFRIQKNIALHHQKIKKNDFDSINEVDYTKPTDSQNIPHTKKIIDSYMKSKFFLFYLIVFLILVLSFIFLAFSQQTYNQKDKISLLSPFVNVIGKQRSSMAKMYLNLLTGIKNSSQISSSIVQNIKMFQTNKKRMIENLITRQFSDEYLNFFKSIWFNPCENLRISNQCTELLSGILNENLDYNYVYIMTEIQKILDNQNNIMTSVFSADILTINEINSQIELSIKRLNFLLFDLMIRLQAAFSKNIQSELDYLLETICSNNLIEFISSILGCLIFLTIIIYLVLLIRQIPKKTLQLITTAIPYTILMRNQYFTQWYKNKFKNVY